MATLMNYEFCNLLEKEKAQYPTILSSICVSFGSPRVLTNDVNKIYSGFVLQNKTIVHRYSNKGDPITSKPSKSSLTHLCSDNKDNRKFIALECNAPNINSTDKLICTNIETSTFNKVFQSNNNKDHFNYLYVSFINITSSENSTLLFKNYSEGDYSFSNSNKMIGDNLMVIICMTRNSEKNSYGNYKIVYVDLNILKNSGSNLNSDISNIFNNIIKNKPITAIQMRIVPKTMMTNEYLTPLLIEKKTPIDNSNIYDVNNQQKYIESNEYTKPDESEIFPKEKPILTNNSSSSKPSSNTSSKIDSNKTQMENWRRGGKNKKIIIYQTKRRYKKYNKTKTKTHTNLKKKKRTKKNKK